MQSASVVDLIDEAGKVGGDIFEGLIIHQIDGLDLERLHEALSLGVVVGIAASTHGTDQTMVGEDIAVDLGSVLRAAIRVVNAAFRWPPYSDSRLQRRNGKTSIDRAADRIANDAARPGIKDYRQIDEARRNADVGDIRDPELIWAIDDPVAGEVREDWAVVIAVSRSYEPPLLLVQACERHACEMRRRPSIRWRSNSENGSSGGCFVTVQYEGNAMQACARCGTVYGPAYEDPRRHAICQTVPAERLSEWNRFGVRCKANVFVFYCPGCALMIGSQVRKMGEDLYWDFELVQ